MDDLIERLGRIDIYLLDQIMKGRFRPGGKILDAGCGDGRNLPLFLQNGFDVYGIDPSDIAIESLRQFAGKHTTNDPADRFRTELIEENSFESDYFDAVICNAVLHFARDEAHFESMMNELWRVLKPGGFFFARLTSDIGIEDRVTKIGGRRFRLPDGSDRFLVDHDMLLNWEKSTGARQLDPIKTVNVQDQRCMTTWCLTK